MGVVTPGHALVALGAPLTIRDPSHLGRRATTRAAAPPRADDAAPPDGADNLDQTREGTSRAAGTNGEEMGGQEEHVALEVIIREGSVTVRCKSAKRPQGPRDPALPPPVPAVGEDGQGAGAGGGSCGGRDDVHSTLGACGHVESGIATAGAAGEAPADLKCRRGGPAAARLLWHASGKQQVRLAAAVCCVLGGGGDPGGTGSRGSRLSVRWSDLWLGLLRSFWDGLGVWASVYP